jgi:hypothetical protein
LARLGLHAEALTLPAATPPDSALTLRAPVARDMAALIRQMGVEL